MTLCYLVTVHQKGIQQQKREHTGEESTKESIHMMVLKIIEVYNARYYY